MESILISSGNLPDFKIYGILMISHLSYIPIMHKAIFVSSGKGSNTASRPLDLSLDLLLDHLFKPLPDQLKLEVEIQLFL